jgi:hypothetical protein
MRNDRSNKNGNFRGNRRNVTVARDVKPGQHTVRCGGKRQNGWNKNKYNTRRGNNDRSGRYRNNQDLEDNQNVIRRIVEGEELTQRKIGKIIRDLEREETRKKTKRM